MALIACPNCGGSVSSSAVKCPHCGAELMPTPVTTTPIVNTDMMICPHCGKGIAADSNYCEYCGNKVETVKKTPSHPLSSTTKIGSLLMILLGFVSVILIAVQRSHINDTSLSLDFYRSVMGFMYAFAALFFLIQSFKSKVIMGQVLAFLGFVFALFLEITYLKFTSNTEYWEDKTWRWIYENYDYFCLAFGLLIVWFAGTLQDWSKYIMMAAGVVFIAELSYRLHNGECMSSLMAHHTMLILGLLTGISLMGMLIAWLVEASSDTKHPAVRLLAGLTTLLILGTITVVAISMKDILDTNYESGMSHVKLAMIFMMISGAVSLCLALAISKNKVLYAVSAVYMALAMFLILGYYMEFSINTHYWDDAFWKQYENQERDLYFSALFMLPISIMMVYVAKLTKGLTGKISIKMQ